MTKAGKVTWGSKDNQGNLEIREWLVCRAFQGRRGQMVMEDLEASQAQKVLWALWDSLDL